MAHSRREKALQNDLEGYVFGLFLLYLVCFYEEIRIISNAFNVNYHWFPPMSWRNSGASVLRFRELLLTEKHHCLFSLTVEPGGDGIALRRTGVFMSAHVGQVCCVIGVERQPDQKEHFSHNFYPFPM